VADGPLPPEENPFATQGEQRHGLRQRRQQKIINEIQRNRRGEYLVPTWVFVAAIVFVVAAFAAMLTFG
jgi:hypothetical protein